MRIVFFAGADRTGKSTLTDMLHNVYGWKYMHFSPPKGSPYREYRDFADRLAADKASGLDANWVVDRYMYCEFPYSMHYGRRTDMTYARMNEIERDVLALDPRAAVVYCETDIKSNWERIQAEGKGEFSSIEDLAALRAEYALTLGKSLLRVVRYDFTRGDTPAGLFAKLGV